MSLNEPGITSNKSKAHHPKDIPAMEGCDPYAMLCQEQAPKAKANTPNLTPLLTRAANQYHTTRVKGMHISVRAKIQVHINHDLGIEDQLAGYELMGPNWQPKIINIHAPFSDE